jgi:hypothetical protein
VTSFVIGRRNLLNLVFISATISGERERDANDDLMRVGGWISKGTDDLSLTTKQTTLRDQLTNTTQHTLLFIATAPLPFALRSMLVSFVIWPRVLPRTARVPLSSSSPTPSTRLSPSFARCSRDMACSTQRSKYPPSAPETGVHYGIEIIVGRATSGDGNYGRSLFPWVKRERVEWVTFSTTFKLGVDIYGS